MKKLLTVFALLMLLVMPALAETKIYTYCGSGKDWISDIAIAPDGRMALTGYTDSSDGTLSDRTKTWRAGWVMMLDAQMNVMWNYCSRSGDADHIRLPVFQEDGSLTVVHETEGKQVKIVRLDRAGNEMASSTVLTNPIEQSSYWVKGTAQNGYLLVKNLGDAKGGEYTLFDWKGREIRQYDQWEGGCVIGERHVIRAEDGVYYLYAMDDAGGETKLAQVCAADADGNFERGYNRIISLEGGGAAACGHTWEGGAPKDRQGLLSCWDAQGKLVFEMMIPMASDMVDMVKTQEGYAAVCYSQADLGEAVKWSLMRFDEMGVRSGECDLGETDAPVAAMAQRTDGALVIAQMAGNVGYEDVRVTVVE